MVSDSDLKYYAAAQRHYQDYLAEHTSPKAFLVTWLLYQPDPNQLPHLPALSAVRNALSYHSRIYQAGKSSPALNQSASIALEALQDHFGEVAAVLFNKSSLQDAETVVLYYRFPGLDTLLFDFCPEVEYA